MKTCTRCHLEPIPLDKSWCQKCTKEYLRQYKKDHAPHIKDLMKDWRETNREHYTQSKYDIYKTVAGRMTELATRAKRRAKKKGIAFDLTSTFLMRMWDAQSQTCAITNIPLIIPQERTGGKASPFSPSIDKIDPVKGYTEDNVRLVCYAANCCLHDYGAETFHMIANAYVNGILPASLPIFNIKNDNEQSYKQRKDTKYRAGKAGTTTVLFNSTKKSASERELAFDLSKEFIEELFASQNHKCAITKILFDNRVSGGTGKSNPFRPSIDRIDCSQGYTKDNVRLVCVAVNFALNEFGEAVFKQICEAYLTTCQ